MTTTGTSQTVRFTPPDRAMMDAARQLIHTQIASLKLEFLPVMKEKLLPLKTALNAADSQFVSHLAAITAQLSSTDLAPIDLKQQLIEADQRLNSEQKNQALALLNAQRTRQVSALTAVLRSAAQAVAESADDLQQIEVDPGNTNTQDILQRQLEGINLRYSGQEAHINTVAEDRRLLDNAIATFEQHNLAEVFNEALPTAQELSTLAMPSPHLIALEAGLGRLQKLLGKISGALKYSDLVEQRDQLRNRQNSLLAEAQSAQKEAKATAARLEELATLTSLNNNKMIWVQHATQLSDSLYRFLESDITRVEEPAVINLHLEQLNAYMKSLYTIKRTR
ncbi:alpha-xenorhabdolysin family binary toxin subunit B [Pseudomonas viridiflava]|uniref:alpha-xenorhabdolysin family binary toxin subunit B n=1 Tax=Pseudomonas viridiflava TaxID=33069 RepID=UPI00201C3EAA|nr:alpha-xenorhabdolysin family binary toxin subunit B [Pseudomonas viridiflava]